MNLHTYIRQRRDPGKGALFDVQEDFELGWGNGTYADSGGGGGHPQGCDTNYGMPLNPLGDNLVGWEQL